MQNRLNLNTEQEETLISDFIYLDKKLRMSGNTGKVMALDKFANEAYNLSVTEEGWTNYSELLKSALQV